MRQLRRALRLGLTSGISFFWSNVKTYIPFRDRIEEWPDRFDALLTSHDVTDIVLYGDTRQIHAEAIKIATKRNVQIHVFEELVHRTLIDYPRYWDPLTKSITTVEGI